MSPAVPQNRTRRTRRPSRNNGGRQEGVQPSVSKYFKVDGDKLSRVKKICSRCGKGVFMSDHKDRHTCGKCGLTEFIQ